MRPLRSPQTSTASTRSGFARCAAYSHLVEALAIDTIVLIDGGTNILMRGDEAGLGTPAEDMASLAAVSKLDVAIKLVSCLGFGVDAYS